MDAKLLKQLKDSGFPQGGEGAFLEGIGPGEPEKLYSPSLDELIEACGGEFAGLIRTFGGTWYCQRTNGKDTPEFSTREEAVARLWLVLNDTNPQTDPEAA